MSNGSQKYPQRVEYHGIDFGHLPSQQSLTVTRGIGYSIWPLLGHKLTLRALWNQTLWESNSQPYALKAGEVVSQINMALMPKDNEMDSRQVKATEVCHRNVLLFP